MAYQRRAGSVQRAAFDALNQLDEDCIRQATGKARDTLIRKSKASGYAGITFEEATGLEAMMVHIKRTPLFEPLFQQMVAEKIREISNVVRPAPASFVDEVLRLNVQIGRLSQEVEKARSAEGDGGRVVTPREWEDLKKAAEDVKRVADGLMDLARRRCPLRDS